jgi:hypothetical protein
MAIISGGSFSLNAHTILLSFKPCICNGNEKAERLAVVGLKIIPADMVAPDFIFSIQINHIF